MMLFGKLMLITVCASLLYFGLVSGAGVLGTLKYVALGTVCSVAITALYPELRGIRSGDSVAVVSEASVPSLIGKPGYAAADGRKRDRIKVRLDNGSEVIGIVESYIGIISPPKIRLLYEEKLVEQEKLVE